MMDLNIRELSESFSELLPHDKEKFLLSDIETSGIPFLVRKRITQIAHEQFMQSINQPKSDWADIKSPKAQLLWENYMDQMADFLEIPAEKSKEVIHEATEFALKLAVQPRRTIEKVLFEDNESVTKEEISTRLEEFGSNRHLVFALIRYMEKKEKDWLSVDEARKIIKKVDEKFTETHNSLDWMEAVKPIFNVAGPVVASDLIRVFFEEKELHRVARKFDMMESDLGETDFVEVMSSADLLNLSGFEEEQPALFEEEEELTEENEAAMSADKDELSIEEENTKSRLGDIFINSEELEKKEGSAGEEDVEADDDYEDEDQHEPYLLQLFREDDESDSDEQEEETYQTEETGLVSDDEPVAEEFDPEIEADPDRNENKFFDESKDEEVDVSEKETEDVSTNSTDTPNEAKLEDEEYVSWEEDNFDDEDDVSPEEKSDFEREEMSREEEFITDDKESVDEWEDEEDENVEEGSLLNQFMDEDEESEFEILADEDQDKVEKDEPTSIYDELNLTPFEEDDGEDEETDLTEDEEEKEKEESYDFPVEDDIPFKPNDRLDQDFDKEISDDFDDDDTLLTNESDDTDEFDDDEMESDDVPMWKSFLERDNPDDEPSFYFDEGSEESSSEVPPFFDDDEIAEAPVINISGEASNIDDEIEDLSNWLAADRDRFLHEIFDDSKLAYEQALIDLTVFDDWKSASRYLENEIFNKNRIDIYSEVAVDFTDYLHSYFMEYKS